MRRFLFFLASLLLTGDLLAQPARIVKVLGDAVTREDRKPLAGKEWLLSVRVEDASGNPIPGQVVDFVVIGGSGKLISQSGALLSSTSDQTNLGGEAVLFLKTDPSTAAVNGVEARVAGLPSVGFTVNTTTPGVAVDAALLLGLVKENDEKLTSVRADITVTSDAPWMSTTTPTLLRVWEKGDKQKIQVLSPSPETFQLPSATVEPFPQGTQAIQEIVAYQESANEYIIRTRLSGEFFPYTEEHIDATRGIVVKTVEFLRVGEEETKNEVIQEDFVRLSLGSGVSVWVFNKKIEKVYQGLGKVLFTTQSQVTSRSQINAVPDSEFQ